MYKSRLLLTAQAVPSLTAGPAAFTADNMQVKNYIRTTNTNDLTTLTQTFTGEQFQSITGFTRRISCDGAWTELRLRTLFSHHPRGDDSDQ